ncbi:DUF554 domain-containing protein [Anaerorhabdus sp.]|uniref:DUF554 domain-containing protein n=1 Tax=Anaerorhabdus sp. TaxID=1872524 RepID=UPI002FC9D9C4
MGSIVNAICIILGGLLGVMFKHGIKQSIQDSIYKAIGICVIVIGINGVLSNMAIIQEGVLSTSGELIMVVCIVLGTLIGELLDIDGKLNGLSKKIEEKFHLAGFANSFVVASIIFCVGAMAIIGSINDGLLHDPTVLFVKSILDGITSIILGATLGMGVIFSSIPVLIYQGAITLLSGSISTILVGDFLRQICMVGYVLVLCIGINFLAPNKLKVANMLPAILVVIVYNVILMLF